MISRYNQDSMKLEFINNPKIIESLLVAWINFNLNMDK